MTSDEISDGSDGMAYPTGRDRSHQARSVMTAPDESSDEISDGTDANDTPAPHPAYTVKHTYNRDPERWDRGRGT